MSGYRTSSFDPNAAPVGGKPMRPFNWVQWSGVAIEVTGLILFLVTIAQKLSWITQGSDIPATSGIMLMLVGMTMINPRREPSTETTPVQRAANRRMLTITIAICAVVIAAAAAIDYLGA